LIFDNHADHSIIWNVGKPFTIRSMSHPLDARQTKPIADTASLSKNSETDS